MIAANILDSVSVQFILLGVMIIGIFIALLFTIAK